MLSAPPRTEITYLVESFGAVIGPGFADSTCRIWLVPGRELVIAYNARDSGGLARRRVSVSSASFGANGRAVFDSPEGQWSFVEAPCTCGGGQAAHAQIEDGRITLVREAAPDWVTGL